MLFTSPGFARFNWHSCTVASFEGSYYNCLWSGNEGTWHRVISLAQHCWPGLWRYIYCFGSVRRSLYGGRKYTHTQTHTHTHTQTCMHTRTQAVFLHLNLKTDGGFLPYIFTQLAWGFYRNWTWPQIHYH